VLHPNWGIGLATYFSRKSRQKNLHKDDVFLNDKEWLYTFCKETEKMNHHDYYVFGHRHLPLDLAVAHNSRYINLGEWINHYTYGVFDGVSFTLSKFEGNE
jgi:UDP-2,3-diacylglucosamine hydrolase